jgi:hypothetical protein
MIDGSLKTPHTTVSFHFQVEGNRTLPPGDSSPCGVGDVLLLSTIREMMKLLGVWDDQSERSLHATPGFVDVSNLIRDGIDWLSMMIGEEQESR